MKAEPWQFTECLGRITTMVPEWEKEFHADLLAIKTDIFCILPEDSARWWQRLYSVLVRHTGSRAVEGWVQTVGSIWNEYQGR